MRTPTFKAIKLEGEGAPKDDSSSSPPPKKKDVYEPPRSTDRKKASTEAAVVVDDDDDDEEEEEDEDAAAVAALKAKFDDANRMASKLIQGQAYERAVEKLTEALDLAPQVPGAAKHIVTLYNNRSAMYEKIKAYDKAMSDITVVLAMDMLHTKVHIRRARICEAQGNLREALDDYVFATIVQQQRGEMPTSEAKIQELAKELAVQAVPSIMEQLQKADTAGASTAMRPLPSKAHCKNFFDSFAAVHAWKEFYRRIKRADLVDEFDSAAVAASEADGSENASMADQEADRAALNLICYDIAHNDVATAFTGLEQMPLPAYTTTAEAPVTPLPDMPSYLGVSSPYAVDDAATITSSSSSSSSATPADRLMSLAFELKGSEAYLRFQQSSALLNLKQALSYWPDNIDARLKVANVYLEHGDVETASGIYESLLAYCDKLSAVAAERGDDDALTAYMRHVRVWTLLHRPLVSITRNSEGKYRENAIATATADIDRVLDLTATDKDQPIGRAARVSALIRLVHTLSQSKAMVGEVPTAEDNERVKKAAEEAQQLQPKNQGILLVAAELKSMEGEADEALRLVEQAGQCPDAIIGDCTPIFLRASILTSKAMMSFSTNPSPAGMQEARELFEEAEQLYKQALELEPNAIEVLSQYAQFKGTLGDLEKAGELFKAAIELARTRDDIQDLSQLLILNEAQQKVVKQVSGSASG